MPDSWPQWALGALVAAAIIAALAITGGPETARQEARDADRLSDLRALEWHVSCLARNQGGTLPDSLPESLAPTQACPDPLGPDSLLASEGYRYAPITQGDGRSFQLCADFERPDRMASLRQFNPETGCLTARAD